MHGRNDAGGISGVNAGKLNMLHHRRNKSVGTVTDSVCFALQWRDAGNGRSESAGQALRPQRPPYRPVMLSGIINNFHAPAAQHIGRTNHNRIADFLCNLQGPPQR